MTSWQQIVSGLWQSPQKPVRAQGVFLLSRAAFGGAAIKKYLSGVHHSPNIAELFHFVDIDEPFIDL